MNPEDHLGLAHHVAEKYRHRRPAWMEMDDVHAACLLGLVKAARGFDPARGQWSTYAGRCMDNEVLMLFRQRRCDLWVDKPQEAADPAADVQGAAEARDLLRRWARVLTRRQRHVLLLVMLGVSNAEIAARLGISANSVRLLTWRARKKIREVDDGRWRARVPGLRPGRLRTRGAAGQAAG